jgi:hypothetical protein
MHPNERYGTGREYGQALAFMYVLDVANRVLRTFRGGSWLVPRGPAHARGTCHWMTAALRAAGGYSRRDTGADAYGHAEGVRVVGVHAASLGDPFDDVLGYRVDGETAGDQIACVAHFHTSFVGRTDGESSTREISLS